MKIKIIISESNGEDSEDEYKVFKVQEQELYLLVTAVRHSHKDDGKNIKLARLIGGLISLGTDTGMKQFFTSQLKDMQADFVNSLNLAK